MPGLPLSTPLSHLLIAFTIEFDNELDHRLAAADLGHRLPISMVMWTNFLRFVGTGITVGELPEAAGIPKSRTLSTLGGMERWRYVFVTTKATGSDPTAKRDGWGSARALRGEWYVRPTPIGQKTQEIAPPLFGEIEERWERRFGADAIGELRQELGTVIDGLEVELPEYLPIVGSTNGMVAEIEHREGATIAPHLSARLAQALLAYTLDFERTSDLSLPLTANFVRVLDKAGLDVREIPAIAGVSKEATSMALKFLTKTGYVSVDAKARAPHCRRAWRRRRPLPVYMRTSNEHGRHVTAAEGHGGGPRSAHSALRRLAAVSRTAGGRGSSYVEQTNAVIDDPTGRLPHYPMVLHRGGWPDGS